MREGCELALTRTSDRAQQHLTYLVSLARDKDDGPCLSIRANEDRASCSSLIVDVALAPADWHLLLNVLKRLDTTIVVVLTAKGE